MVIKRLQLQHFRNYSTLDCFFSQGLNIIIGENAQGKTNILEAIYAVCTGRSFRTRDDKDLIQFEQPYARVHLETLESGRTTDLTMTLLKNAAKEIRINRNPLQSYGDLIGKVPVIVFSPDDLRLVKEGPQERRRFLDREISLISPGYYHGLIRYHRVLKQRNKLLKSLQFNPSLRDTLEQWDEQLCRSGSDIIVRRLDFINQLSAISRQMHHDISGGREILSVHYLSLADTAKGSCCDTIASDMKAKLMAQTDSDIQRGSTSVGPHRDDFILKVNDMPLKDYGSQGQHRSAALALKLSGIEIIRRETGKGPVVLLDDVMSELDPIRQNALLESLSDSQIIMTTTDTANLAMNRVQTANRYYVFQGTFRNEEDRP